TNVEIKNIGDSAIVVTGSALVINAGVSVHDNCKSTTDHNCAGLQLTNSSVVTINQTDANKNPVRFYHNAIGILAQNQAIVHFTGTPSAYANQGTVSASNNYLAGIFLQSGSPNVASDITGVVMNGNGAFALPIVTDNANFGAGLETDTRPGLLTVRSCTF